MTTDAPLADPNANRAHLVYVPALIFVILCPLFVGLRLWARQAKRVGFGPDDYTAIAALVAGQLLNGFLVGACQHGMGRHFTTLTHSQQTQSMTFFYMAQIVYKLAINLSKISIVLLYLRIFQLIKWFRITCWALLGAISAYCAASVLATALQCSPVSRAMDKSIPGTCINMATFWYANAAFSISTDVILLLIPIPLIYRLEITTWYKLALVGCFAVGVFGVVTSCLRLTSLNVLATSVDQTWDITNVMWTIIESNTAIICGCLPILRSLVGRVVPALRTQNKFSYDNNSSQHSQARIPTHGHSRDKSGWEELGGNHADAFHMKSVHRSGSKHGSEEQITRYTNKEIHRTVEYTVRYSEANEDH